MDSATASKIIDTFSLQGVPEGEWEAVAEQLLDILAKRALLVIARSLNKEARAAFFEAAETDGDRAFGIVAENVPDLDEKLRGAFASTVEEVKSIVASYTRNAQD